MSLWRTNNLMVLRGREIRRLRRRAEHYGLMAAVSAAMASQALTRGSIGEDIIANLRARCAELEAQAPAQQHPEAS